jgi:hypothetical protein
MKIAAVAATHPDTASPPSGPQASTDMQLTDDRTSPPRSILCAPG